MDTGAQMLSTVFALVDAGLPGAAVKLINAEKDVFGISRELFVTGLARNGDHFQLALQDPDGGIGIFSLGPDGQAWFLDRGQWLLVTPTVPAGLRSWVRKFSWN